MIRTAAQTDLDNQNALLALERQLAVAEKDAGEDKRVHRGIKELQRVTKALLACTDSPQKDELETYFRETVAALNNLARSPLPEKMDFFQTPWFFLKRLSRPVGRGRVPAGNLQLDKNPDLSRMDPEPTTFWQRPSDIAGQDLYHGFGHTRRLLEDQPLCSYAGPKESFGRNPGFEVDCKGTRLKLKFAEVSSEAFAARIFFALGYHVDRTDYSPGVKVRYSRDMLREFNFRKPLQTHFTFLGLVPLFTLHLQQRYDPFQYLVRAVLNDGTQWSSAELKRHLFRDATQPHPEADESNFRPEVESAIAYVETVPANVQTKEGKSIGPWDFGQLDHASRRELRGAGLLAGWLGWFDTRFDNTRLRVVQFGGKAQLRHFFSDLGGVLGETGGMLYARGELPNAFAWTFTRREKGGRPATAPVPLSGYKPIARTPAFAAMTLDDARWMARLIAALTENQLTEALVASGFDSAQTRLYVEKLISRRGQMIRDLGLAGEFTQIGTDADNHKFSYDPGRDGPVVVEVSGTSVAAAIGRDRIVKGKLRE